MSATLDSTPAADGFRMPGEFEPHSGCWMAWPERTDNWRLGAKPAQEAFAAVAAAIAASEPVTMAVSDAQFENCRALLPPEVRVVEVSTDDAWMRDTGPTFVVDGDGGRRGVDWRFNAWGGTEGGLYFPWDRDDRVAAKVLEIEGADRYRAPIVLEGGAIHVDGEGTVLTTEECLLNPNRNPELSREQIERALLDYLGAEKVIWLGRGVFEDETDGHVDNLACFARPGRRAADLDRRRGRPPARDLPRRARAAGSGDRRPRPPARGGLLPSPGPLQISAEEAEGVDAARGHAAAPRRRPPGRLLRQLLPRQLADRLPAARPAPRRGGGGDPAPRLPRARGGRRAGARDPPRRRQHPLHHPAGAARGVIRRSRARLSA